MKKDFLTYDYYLSVANNEDSGPVLMAERMRDYSNVHSRYGSIFV